ncbi:MAG: hypothetical protein HY896_02610 [Deltaproteobacteria bacterium]|nr:hypothetical protein [Deltaproteobacteria bacterium]
MEIGAVLKTLQDPMGVPFYPAVFQALMVLTFALHIVLVNLTIGSSFLSVYGYLRNDERWKRLSGSLAKAVTINASMSILLGVAPLLFVQVLYDPFWYSSNLLSAAWVMGFLVIMALAYGFAYIFYLGGKKPGKGAGFAAYGIASFAFFLLAGVIMHVLGYQLLQPDKWLAWYAKGNSVDTSGTSLHAFQLPRFLHFIVPSFAMTGIFLMLYSWYFKNREDMDSEYLAWVGNMGARMALFFTAIQAIVGAWWLLVLPAEFRFASNPLFAAGALLGAGLLIFLYFAQKDPARFAVPAGMAGLAAVLGMSATREALRMKYAGRFAYSIFDYKVNLDFGSTALFLATFVMGLVIVSYLLAVAFQSGRVAGPYEASPSLQKLGKAGIALLLLWIVVVAGLGVVITVRNFL